MEKKQNYVVVFDNNVTDDVIIRRFTDMTYDEMFNEAMSYSGKSFLSYGNFTIYHNEYELFELEQKYERDRVNWVDQINKLAEENEFNKNLYEQQFKSLKRNYKSKILKELDLELQGLADIAELLDETNKLRLKRRIVRIQKILEKEGD